MVKKKLNKLAARQLHISLVPLPRLAVFKPPALALRTVTSKDGFGVYASSDTMFKGAIFGRDSLEVAEDLMGLRPKLVERILLTLGSLQGEEQRDDNEEEPGKIIHEYRRAVVDGKLLDDASMHILRQLASHWGGTNELLAYYGSIDATPHFIRTTYRYTELYGSGILHKKLQTRSGRHMTLATCVERAIDWLIDSLQQSRSGLLEFKRRNPMGIENQVWKDSREFYVHENGQMANHHQPISSIEVQALAYDALTMAAAHMPSRQVELQETAANLRRRTIELLWESDRQYFGLGTDYDDNSQLRIIKTITANPAEMLDSVFFDDLTDGEKQLYISSIVTGIMGDQFLTDAGIRSRSLSEANLVTFWDYHGSYTSWPKETYDIAKGLRRQGFPRLAQQLENRLLNVVKLLRSYPEFIYVDARGRVLGAASSAHTHAELVLIDSTNRPEKIQAWTVSAVLAILADRRPLKLKLREALPAQEDWQFKLETDIIRSIPRVLHLKSSKALKARYPTYPYDLKIRG